MRLLNDPRFQRVWAKLPPVLDVALVVLLSLILLAAMNTWLEYHIGRSTIESLYEALFYTLILRAVVAVPWREAKELSLGRKFLCAGAALVSLFVVSRMVQGNLYWGLRAVVESRGKFYDLSNDEIAIEITEHNKWYPRESFIQDAKALIPEDAGILYFGDQRAHIMSYRLYPRRVYMMPELQTALNLATEDNWTWEEISDPFHPQKDPLNIKVEPITPQEAFDSATADHLKEMIRKYDIGFVMYYDSLYSDRSFVAPMPDVLRGDAEATP